MKSTAIFLPRFFQGSFVSRVLSSLIIYISVHSVSVAQPNQVITVQPDPLPDALVTDDTYTVSASATSGLPVTYGLLNDPNGCVASFDAATGVFQLTDNTGQVTISIDQPGDMVWNPAPQLVRNFRVKVPQAINVVTNLPIGLTTDDTYTVTATATSGLPVTYGLVSDPNGCVASFNPTTGVFNLTNNYGEITISLSQPGNDTYAAAATITRSFRIKVPQSLTITNFPPAILYANQKVASTYAVAQPSGLPVSYSISTSPTNLATIDANGLITLTPQPGINMEGNAEVTYTQAGDDTYAPVEIKTTFSIRRQFQLMFLTVERTEVEFGASPIRIRVSSVSGLPADISIETIPSGIATLDGGVTELTGRTECYLTLNNRLDAPGTGTVIITATQKGNNFFLSDTDTVEVEIRPATLTLSYVKVPIGMSYLGSAQSLIATWSIPSATNSNIRKSIVSSAPDTLLNATLDQAGAQRATIALAGIFQDGFQYNYIVTPNLGAGPVLFTLNLNPLADPYNNLNPVFTLESNITEFQINPTNFIFRFLNDYPDITFGEFPFPIAAEARHPITNDILTSTVISYKVADGPAYLGQNNQVITYGTGRVLLEALATPVDVNMDGEYDFLGQTVQDSYVSRTGNLTSGQIFLDRWTWRNPNPNEKFYNDIIFTDRYVAVGDAARISYTDTGSNGYRDWSINMVAGIPSSTNLNGVAYSGVIYVAVGDDGVAYHTSDPTSGWNSVPVDPGITLTSLKYANGIFVATGANGKVYSSEDGVDWFAGVIAFPPGTDSNSIQSLNSVVFIGENTWVAVGDRGTVAYSKDNSHSWTLGISGTVFDLNYVSFQLIQDPLNPFSRIPQLLAVGDNGIILSSEDGEHWLTENSPTTENLYAIAVATHLQQNDPSNPSDDLENYYYIALGVDGKVLTSRDGYVWTDRVSRFLNDYAAAVFANGFFIAVGDNYSIFSSPTGESWSLLESDQPESINNAAYGNGTYVAIGQNGTILTSVDSINWDTVTPAPTLEDLYGIAFGNNRFVVVGTNGTFLVSDDAVTWSAAANPPSKPFDNINYFDVTYDGKGQFVAVGEDFTIAVSADGNNWQPQTVTFGTRHDLHDVEYAAAIDTYVAVGDNGSILISNDGLNWRFRYLGISIHLRGVSYGEDSGKFVVVGDNGFIATSNFGDVWQYVTSGTTYHINSIAYLADQEPAVGGTFVAVGENFQILASRDGIDWSVQISGNLNSLWGVVHANNTFVAVGEHQTILTATSAIPSGLDEWRQHNPLPDDIIFRSIVYERNTYVAVGDQGKILTSNDGFTWTERISGTTDNITDVTYGNDRFVAVGGQSILTSTNGITWTTQRTWHFPLNAVSYLNGLFVAVGDGGLVITSSNGIDWLLGGAFPYAKTQPNLYDISYGNGYFIVVGSPVSVDMICAGQVRPFDMSAISISSDGIRWTQMVPPIVGFTTEGCPIYLSSTLLGVDYGNGVFMLVGDNFTVLRWDGTISNIVAGIGLPYVASSDFALTITGTGTLNKVAYGGGNGVGRFTVVGNGGILFTTVDGTEYELRYPGVTSNLNNVIFGNETYLVVGESGRILSSPNATVWTSIRSSGFISTINAFGYNGSQLVAGANDGRILTSPDGVRWTERVSGTSLNINSIVYGRNKFVAVTDRGWSVISSDGVSWTPIFSGFLDDFNDALFYQQGELQVFYVVCTNGLILSSSDGEQWNLEKSSTSNHLYGITRGADKFIAIGAKGTILYSSDGTNWTVTNNIFPAVNYDFHDVAYGNGVYITVGRFGSIYRSTDGVNWTKQNSLTDYRLDSVHYGDGFFVATGQEGTVLTSNDGISWKKRPPVTRTSLLASRYADGLFIAGGDFGTIITSGELVVKIPQTIFFPKIGNVAVYDSSVPDSKSQFALQAVASSGLDVVYRITSGSNIASVSNNLITLVELQAGDVTVQADQPGNKNYLPAEPVSRTFSVIPTNHTIDFPPIPNAVFKQGPISLAATSSEGLEVFYRVVFGPGAIDGNQLILLGAGLITVEAYSDGDDTSNPKISPASKRQSVSVAKANQIISFSPISNKSFGDPPFRLQASSDSGLPITYKINQGPAIVSPDGYLTITGAGTVQVSATQLGDDNFNPATEVVRTFLVESAPPGNVWTPAAILPALALGENLLSVDYVGNSYLIGGTNLRLFRSVDGNEWSVVTTGVGTITASAFGNGLYLALSGNLILSSLNGIDWLVTPTNLPNTASFDDIVFADGRFVAVGNTIATSVNGTEWEVADVSTLLGSANLTSIAYGNAIYVAVGTGGITLRGVVNDRGELIWSSPTVLLPGTLNDVVFGNGIFVAVGDQNNVRTSIDGLNWTIRSIAGGNFNSITYGNNRYLTVGDGGIIYSSQDSINWTARISGVTANLNAVTYTNNQFVAVGDSGTIITSGTVISRQAQEITFLPLANLKVGFATPLGLATTNQGLPVTFVIFRGQADLEVVNNTTYVIPQSTETLEIRATQDGNANFAPALTKAQILNVAKGDQDLILPSGFNYSLGQPDIEIITDPSVTLAPNQAYFYAVDRNNPNFTTGSTITISVAGGAVGLVQVQNGEVIQQFLRILAEGQSTVTVTAAGNGNYHPVTEQFTINVSGVFPTGFIISPTDTSVVTATTAVFLQASAVDTGAGAGVADVRFYANGGLIETATALSGTSIYYSSWIPGLPGTYAITVEIEDVDGNISVVGPNVITVINPVGFAPTISLQAPANGNTNSQIPLLATAADTDGSITKVEFFVNGILIDTDSNAPYATTFTTGIAGSYVLTAMATDSAGNTSTSLPKLITIGDVSIGEVPTVTILQPTGLSSPTSHSRVLIWAGADDLDGSVASVEFYVDGKLLGSDNTFPYTIGWIPKKAGTFNLQAVAIDNQGNRGYSNPVQVTTLVSRSQAPVVALSAPASYVVGSSIFLTGQNAFDPDGFIDTAQFYLNGVPFGAPISRPSANFTRFWSASNRGQYVVGLTVTDNTGNTYEADPVLVTVTQSASFNIDIVQPLLTDKIPEKSQIIIEAKASNVTGSLRQVDFYVDNVLIGSDTLAPYTAIWQNFSRGNHRIVVIATDISGTTASDEITVTAEEPIGTPPTVNVSITADGNLTENSQIIVYAYVEDIEDDAKGLAPKVEFYLNGEQITNLRPEAPFFARMQPIALTDDVTDPNYRNYEVRVIVRDSDNNTTIDTRNQLYSADIFVNRPILTVLAPVQKETIDEGLPFTIRAKVNGAGSNDVARVIFYENGSEIGSATTPDASGNYTFTWTPVITNGTNSQDFVITAACLRTALSWDSNPDDLEDEFINVTPVSLSQDIVVTVAKGNAGSAPTVSIIEPLNNARYVRGTTLDINVLADDSDGIIRQVDILANGAVIAQLTQPPYAITWTPAAASTYQLTARATDNQGNSSTSAVVNVEITAPQGNIPTVVLTSPANASTFTSSSSILLQAGAADIGGGIDKVEFIVNGSIVGSDSLAPFTYAWTPSAPGTYRVVAVAADTDGNVVRSTPVSLTVTPGSSQPPVVSISDPGTVVVNRDNIIQITASDEDGVVSLVELFANGTKIGEGTSASSLFQIPWRPSATGTYTLVAVATDNSANVVSAIRAVTVTNAVGQLPSVSISSPAAGASLLVAESVTIEAEASDPDGIIASVQFFINGVSLSTPDIAEPFTASWTPLVSGTYVIKAVATDNSGSSVESSIVVAVVGNKPPVVDFVHPNADLAFTLGSTYTLLAEAYDEDGSVAAVVFSANGVVLQTITTPPYQFDWFPTAVSTANQGRYRITAEAIDNRGRRSSDTVFITVKAPSGNAPEVSIVAPVAGKVFTASSNLLVEMSALDTDGTIASVQLLVDGELYATLNSQPYATTWKPGLAGTYQLSAVATDNSNNIVYSAPVSVTATNSIGVGPVLALTNPGKVTKGTATLLAATAADPDGNIRQVEFFANSVSVGLDTVAPYRVSWTPGQAGIYSLVAVATDNVGNTTATLPAIVTVEDGKAPSVSVTVKNTSDGKILINRAAVLEAMAADEDGLVTSVQFFINDVAQEPIDTTYPYQFQFQPSSSGLYVIHAEATDNAGNTAASQKVTVEVVSVIGQSPQAAINYPLNGATLVVGRSISINVSATDPDGLITAVELWQTPALGGLSPTLLATANSEPFTFSWTPLVSGNYSFYAVAVDNTGNRFTSSTVSVAAQSNQAPTASLIFPDATATSTFTLGSTLPLVVEAGDTDGRVASVQFLVNNLSVGSDNSQPFTVPWTPSATGTYRLKAVVTDDLGAVTTSAEATVIISAVKGGTQPSIALLDPISGLTFSAASTVMFEATATDDQTVTDVTFYANGKKIGSALTNDSHYFMQTWNPAVAGDYQIVALAADNDGNKVISAPLAVVATVGSGKAPTIETPALPANATRSLTTIISVAAQDADGRVGRVDFYADGELLGSDNNAPFTLRWTPSEPGLYNIFAVAVDNRGNIATSGVKTVTVDDLKDPFHLTITAPTSNTLRLGSDVIIEAARAADTTRIVRTVNFYVNDNLVGEDNVAPYTVVWTPETTGTQVIRVEAIDVLGNTSTSAYKTIVIEPVSTSNLPPELEVSLTADGNISDNSNIIVTTQIFDEMPTSVHLTYYLNGQEINPVIHEEVASNGIYPLISDAPGRSQFGVSYAIIRPRTISDDPNTSNYRTYELRIIAKDEAGNSKASIIDNVYIDTRNLSRPSAILTTSAANNTLDSGNSVAITANIIGSNQDDIAKVIFYANGQRIGEDASAPYSIDWLPPSPELNQTDHYYLAAAVLRNSYTIDIDPSEAGTNLYTFTPVSVSSEIKLSVAYVDPGPNPIVQFITPDSDKSFSLGASIDLTSSAAVEGRSIRQIEYFVTRFNGNNPVTAERSIGTSSAEPYAISFTPTVQGRYRLVARATSSTGKVGEAVIFINVYDGAIPEVTKFVANVASNIVFTGTEVSFTAEANVAGGIAYVEFYRLGYSQPLAVDTVEPYLFKGELRFDPGYPYDLQYQVYYAIAYSKKGIPGRSENLVMTIVAPQPSVVDVEHNQDYVAQTHQDLLLRRVTEAESEKLEAQLFDARLTLANARAQMMQKVMESAEFLPILDIHSLYYLFYSRWPTREEVEVAFAIYSIYGFNALVQEHLSKVNNLGPYESLPTYRSSPGDIRKFLELLYRLKYETDRYNPDHLNRLSESFARSSLDVFLANWVMDTGLFGGTTTYSRVFRLENPPNDNLYRWSQTAVLFTCVRRTTVGHNTVKAESPKALLDRIKDALNSSEYNHRFESRIPFDPHAVGYPGDWYLSQWFGWYNTTFYPWIYHGEHGWIYLPSQPKENLWIFTSDMGWIWTSHGYYPFLYRAKDQQWLWYQVGSQNPRVFVTTSGQVENR